MLGRLCVALCVLLGLPMPTAATEAGAVPCQGLAGLYAFSAQIEPGSAPLAPGVQPNIGLLLFPGSDLAYDERFDRYRITHADGRFQLELLTVHGAMKRFPIAAAEDFVYCLDDELIIERQRRTLASSVLEYSRYRHVLRRLRSGELEVRTTITGKFRNWLTSWEKPPARYAARFAPIIPPR